MSDAFVQLRKDLLADRPSLGKYMAKKSYPRNVTELSSCSLRPTVQPKPVQKRTTRKLKEDPEGFTSVPPKKVNNEEDVFKHRGKKYKRVVYGPDNQFLVHKGLNPPPSYSTNICSDKLDEMGNKTSLLMAAREVKAEEALKQKNVKGEESEARRDELKNMTSYKSGVVDDLVKQNRAKTRWILRNADRAMTDQLEEMRDFYGHVGSTQVLAMRELQIEDNKHLKDIGVKSGEIYFQDALDLDKGRPSEYDDMVERRASLLKKNRQIVEVMKNQVLEKEMLRNLEVEENLENALRLDALTEAELEKRMNNKEAEEKEKQQHFDTFTAITNYRDYLRGVRVAEEEALWQREKDFLEQKAKFNEAYQAKMDKIKADRQRLVSTVRADLGASYEKQEQEEMEYYYTLQKERDIQLEDQEVQEKLNKKAAMEELMKDWAKITEHNQLIKQQQQMRENEEKERMKKFLELENNAKKAEERKKLVEKDINRMEIMYQINERERNRQEEAEAKAREIKLLRAEGFVREGKLKDRMLERTDDFKNNGLPERFLSNIRKHYNL